MTAAPAGPRLAERAPQAPRPPPLTPLGPGHAAAGCVRPAAGITTPRSAGRRRTGDVIMRSDQVEQLRRREEACAYGIPGVSDGRSIEFR